MISFSFCLKTTPKWGQRKSLEELLKVCKNDHGTKATKNMTVENDELLLHSRRNYLHLLLKQLYYIIVFKLNVWRKIKIKYSLVSRV